MGKSVPETEETMKMCKCPGCPTFNGSPLSGGFFCAKGKAKETIEDQGCLCTSCPVFNKYGLNKGYFCVNGKSADL